MIKKMPAKVPDVRIVANSLWTSGFPYGTLYLQFEDNNVSVWWGYNAVHENELSEMEASISILKGMLTRAIADIEEFQSTLPTVTEEPC